MYIKILFKKKNTFFLFKKHKQVFDCSNRSLYKFKHCEPDPAHTEATRDWIWQLQSMKSAMRICFMLSHKICIIEYIPFKDKCEHKLPGFT